LWAALLRRFAAETCCLVLRQLKIKLAREAFDERFGASECAEKLLIEGSVVKDRLLSDG
jgi:hypothetical protein